VSGINESPACRLQAFVAFAEFVASLSLFSLALLFLPLLFARNERINTYLERFLTDVFAGNIFAHLLLPLPSLDYVGLSFPVQGIKNEEF
jgi:hypothetical protein